MLLLRRAVCGWITARACYRGRRSVFLRWGNLITMTRSAPQLRLMSGSLRRRRAARLPKPIQRRNPLARIGQVSRWPLMSRSAKPVPSGCSSVSKAARSSFLNAASPSKTSRQKGAQGSAAVFSASPSSGSRTSSAARRWRLARRFFEATGGAPNSEALQSALNVIEAKAHFDAPERVVHVRVGGLDGRLYLDLGDDTWRAVEIVATGWRVIDNPPVRFRRAGGMQAPCRRRSRRIGRGAEVLPQRQVRCRLCADRCMGAGVPAQRRPLSCPRVVWRAGIGQVHLFRDPSGAA